MPLLVTEALAVAEQVTHPMPHESPTHIVLFGLAPKRDSVTLDRVRELHDEQREAEQRWITRGASLEDVVAAAEGKALCGVRVDDPRAPVSTLLIDDAARWTGLCEACWNVAARFLDAEKR
jgi:hypothetical protein